MSMLDGRNPEVGRPMINPGLEVIEAGIDFGNADPRFDAPEVVRGVRWAMRAALETPLTQVFTINPKNETDFVDLDTANPTGNPRVLRSGLYPSGYSEEGVEEYQIEADAMITTQPNVGLIFGAADCIPLVVHEPAQGLLAMIHMGRRGAIHNFHTATMDYMKQAHGFDPARAYAYLGPSIGPASYFFPRLLDIDPTDPEWAPHVPKKGANYHIDIPAFVVRTLEAYGLKPGNITQSPVDVGAEGSRYFSHTRFNKKSGPEGRNPFMAVMR